MNGRTCFYKVKSGCSAPAFDIANVTGGYDVEWIEFDESALNDTAYVALGTATPVSATARNSPPATDMPLRWSAFEDGEGSSQIYKQ